MTVALGRNGVARYFVTSMRRLVVRFAFVLALPVALAAQSPAPVVPRVQIQPDALTFGPPGAAIQTAAVLGDPSKPGIYVTRLRFAKGTRIPPHLHPDERVAVALSGSMGFAYGNTFDESALTHMTAGSTWTEPPNTAHFAWAKDEDVVIQVVGIGPSGSKPAQ
jgi:quercetin dioxygenase-like cupin family protein